MGLHLASSSIRIYIVDMTLVSCSRTVPKFCLLIVFVVIQEVATSSPVRFHFGSTDRKACCSHFSCLDDAPDKPIIDVSSAHGLNEPCSGAFLSSDTDGEQTEKGSPPPPPSPFFRPPSLCLSVSFHPSIIHPHASFGYLPLS